MSAGRKKVFILGLDGADWKILDHMIEKGIMPNLKKMRDNGPWGPLNSTIPPMTCPAWISYGTGKNPGKFGIYYFSMSRTEEYKEHPYYFIKKIGKENFWDLLSNSGRKVGVINIPTINSPYPVDGFMISGFTTVNKNYKIDKDGLDMEKTSTVSYPDDLMEEIVEHTGEYFIDPPEKFTEKWRKMTVDDKLRSFLKTAIKRKEAVQYLMENKEWDLFVTDFMITDRMSHELYQVISKDGVKYDTPLGSKWRKKIEEVYGQIDGIVGDLRRSAGKDCYFMIMSDHGFGNQTGKFAVNDWLIKNGYLKLKKGKEVQSSGKKPLKLRIYHFLSRISRKLRLSGLIEKFKKAAPKGLGSKIPTPFEKFSFDHVDWSKTRLYYNNLGQIFVNLEGREKNGIVKEGERKQLVDEAIGRLKKDASEYFGNDDQLRVKRGSEIYFGRFAKDGPDIYFDMGSNDQKEYYSIDTQIGFQSVFMKDPEHMYGFHRQKGVFVLDHPDARKGRFDDLDIMDICPTVLHLFGEKIPEDVDGKVMLKVFKEDSDPHIRKIEMVERSERTNLNRAIKNLKINI